LQNGLHVERVRESRKEREREREQETKLEKRGETMSGLSKKNGPVWGPSNLK
jgi:hypothetical protein